MFTNLKFGSVCFQCYLACFRFLRVGIFHLTKVLTQNLEQSMLHCIYYIKLYPCTSKQELDQGATIKVSEFHQIYQATTYTSPQKLVFSLLISKPVLT